MMISLRPLRKVLTRLLRICKKSEKARDFIFWPLSYRLLPQSYSEIITLKNGVKIKVYQDVLDMANKTIMFLGEGEMYPWEPGTSKLVTALMKDKMVVLVAGGHLGYFALITAAANPKASVFVFEPTSKMYGRLVKNIELNTYQNIVTEHKALAKVNGPVKIIVDDGQSSLIKHSGNAHKGAEIVDGVTIDSYFDSGPLPDLIILDIEGYELYALQGAEKVLSHKPDIILEINAKMLDRAGTSESEVFGWLTARGYSVKVITEVDAEKEKRQGHYNVFVTAKK